MQYRKEIDGLRAIAVIPVILFHAGIEGFNGGYIGVDIFFVISGYLITSIILQEHENKTFSIIDFYERRARRILPALSVVLICTTLATLIFMPAEHMKAYSQSLASVASFSSNIFFYSTSGYFSSASDEKPLLHTWSLAVEEQYYLFFPVLITLLWFLGKKHIACLIAALSIASLLYSEYLLSQQHYDANFYLIFSRSWELFSGSLIAFFSLTRWPLKKWHREIIGIAGILLIFYSITVFDKHTPFPGLYALVPVLGTFAIIAFVNDTTLIGRLLANKVLVFIGLISYSLYLWHQPLFALLRLKSIGEPKPYLFVVAIFLTFILSCFSWKFIETPFRNKSAFPRIAIFRYSAVSLVLFLSIGVAGIFSNGFEQRFEHSPYTETIAFSPKREECHVNDLKYLSPEMACEYFGKNVNWAAFGDSHLVEVAYALAKKIEHDGNGLTQLTFAGCAPAIYFEVRRKGCNEWIQTALSYLENNDKIENVLLGFRYTSFLYGGQLSNYPDVPNISPIKNHFTPDFTETLTEDPRKLYWRSFSEIVSRLLKAGKRIYLLYPMPELPAHMSKAITPFSIFGDKTTVDLIRTTNVDYYYRRNYPAIAELNKLPFGDKLRAIKPFELFCDDQFCPAVKDGKALYFDDNHPSVAAGKFIAENIMSMQKI